MFHYHNNDVFNRLTYFVHHWEHFICDLVCFITCITIHNALLLSHFHSAHSLQLLFIPEIVSFCAYGSLPYSEPENYHKKPRPLLLINTYTSDTLRELSALLPELEQLLYVPEPLRDVDRAGGAGKTLHRVEKLRFYLKLKYGFLSCVKHSLATL